MEVYLGVDVGSVTTKLAAVDKNGELLGHIYLPTQGKPIEMVQTGLREIKGQLPQEVEICGVATTGSARYLAGVVVGADLVKNEITCHAMGTLHYIPEVQTIIEIGGQDSKIIIVRDGIVTDFGMNTVCAAGTGSFLAHQALRLGIGIEEFAQRALTSRTPVRIAGRCTVFGESDMIHKQQMGHQIEDILYGLCQALVRNYLNNVGLGKKIDSPIVFQGGVAFNQAIVKAFHEELKTEVIVPPHHEIMGAIGAALLVYEEVLSKNRRSQFMGFGTSEAKYHTTSFECESCPNLCEIAQLVLDDQVLARWGGRCDLWERVQAEEVK
ncbi:MAG: acyl-CoA dehydratase activase [Dehalococcoidales bacterium]|jgi:predicted CoA-substrate-specific enzyme activase|nr:acyl-CoA dehydratase activase [Dehalococcoidales bacterium]MDP7109560.1 acyl-CoA dehydratase activase [Dehalococcoidales bacterium]MDP7309761.1 acyl-CoA dehydratase activase [Dehalococcoidales bacterium]MDP7409306.1 acyl-CoA dehydratase activase [Dehalococcoidales bacterium]MDP7675640.1 acyl-CoA dehydratase activase [Dehalococcoidales bacterium]|tara:strand:+ start:1274 stop:2248 length:975 start_codon:yes stop_codon:yes gene_type:complete